MQSIILFSSIFIPALMLYILLRESYTTSFVCFPAAMLGSSTALNMQLMGLTNAHKTTPRYYGISVQDGVVTLTGASSKCAEAHYTYSELLVAIRKIDDALNESCRKFNRI